MNSVLARHSSSTDEHQKQFQEEIEILLLQVRREKGFLWGGGSAWKPWSKTHVHPPALAGFLCDFIKSLLP